MRTAREIYDQLAERQKRINQAWDYQNTLESLTINQLRRTYRMVFQKQPKGTRRQPLIDALVDSKLEFLELDRETYEEADK